MTPDAWIARAWMPSSTLRRRLSRLVLLTVVAVVVPGLAEASPALRDLTPEDIAAWKIITGPLLSPDGKWLVYTLSPSGARRTTGDRTVVIRSVRTSHEQRFSAGPSAPGREVQLSPTGRWVGFIRNRGAGSAEKTAGIADDAVVVELKTGVTSTFPSVQSLRFVGREDDQILLAQKKSDGTQSIRILGLGKTAGAAGFAIPDATSFSVSPDGALLAWITPAGLFIRDLQSQRLIATDPAQAGTTFTGLNWSASSRALAAVRESSATELLCFSGLGTEHSEMQRIRGNELTPAFLRFSRQMRWREDDRGLFADVEEQPAAAGDPDSAEHGVAIWNWQDPLLPEERRERAAEPRTASYFISLPSQKAVRLNGAEDISVIPHGRGRYVLGYDTRRFGPANPEEGAHTSQARDYSLVDLSDGSRHPLLQDLNVITVPGLSVPPILSPDGRFVLYQSNAGDYLSYDTTTGVTADITRATGVPFFYPENDPRTRHQPRPLENGAPSALEGWSSDGSAVLLSDHYDIWLLSLTGTSAVNLTGDGRASGTLYSLGPRGSMAQDPQARIVNTAAPLLFQSWSPATAHTGLTRWDPATARARKLYSDQAELSYLRATGSPAMIVARGTGTQFPDFYAADATGRPGRRLTEANPQQKEFAWPPQATYLSYVTDHGDQLHGTLYPPLGYRPGEKYPTVVRIYEEWPGNYTRYIAPNDPFIFEWLRDGYAVLLPDIRPRFKDAGRAALEAVSAAIAAADKTGIIDTQRLGLTGHSYGGYETYFIAANSGLFRAAAPEAGETDLLSRYGSLRGNTASSFTMEYLQPYMAVPWWEDREAWIRNSPLFSAPQMTTPLLIAHGDRDVTVPFSQAIEMFLTLRRLGKTPVVLLQYVGETHVFSRRSHEDLNRRQHQFFDHYLRGRPAPQWWTSGLSRFNALDAKVQ